MLFSFDLSRAEVSYITVPETSTTAQTKYTLINKIPTTITVTEHTEALWVYLPRFFPKSGTTNNGLYLLFQKDSSYIQLLETESESIFYIYEYDAPNTKIKIKRIGNPVIPKRWTHIAIVTSMKSFDNILEKSHALYINGIPNHDISIVPLFNVANIDNYFSVQFFLL